VPDPVRIPGLKIWPAGGGVVAWLPRQRVRDQPGTSRLMLTIGGSAQRDRRIRLEGLAGAGEDR